MAPSAIGLRHVLVLTGALLQPAVAFDISKRQACRDSNLCLETFIWCAGGNDDTSGCSFPDHAYPYHEAEYSSNPAALFLQREYTLSWRQAVPDYPVQVAWSFQEEDRGNAYYISKNITKGTNSVTFKFEDWIKEYSDGDKNVTTGEMTAAASSLLNSISISQPMAANDSQFSDRILSDTSSQFAVFEGLAERYLNTQRTIGKHSMYDKWKLGVGVGVGVGVPILMAAAFVIGWFGAKRQHSKSAVVKDTSSR